MNIAKQPTPKRMVVDRIGKFFTLPPLSYAKKKDVRVDTEHPLLRFLLLQMRHSHIRRFDIYLVGRANLVCNGT